MKKFSLALLVTSLVLFGVVIQTDAYTYNNLFGETIGGYLTIDRSDTNKDVKVAEYQGYESVSPATYSGYYLGTWNIGKGSGDALLPLAISAYLGSSWTGDFYKAESSNNWENGPLEVSFHDSSHLTGNWTYSGANGIGFYALKAGGDIALYFVDPAVTSGVWSSQHLLNNGGNQPELSHLSASSVPVPPSVWLLGAGLVGLVGLRRRFKQRVVNGETLQDMERRRS